jgi:calcineurin-like phosphoesterase family protein
MRGTIPSLDQNEWIARYHVAEALGLQPGERAEWSNSRYRTIIKMHESSAHALGKLMDFFTADTHFGHANIIRYCHRPFASVEEMNAALVARWNGQVGPRDTVYHLGDFALGPKALWPYFRRQLHGKIVFVLGNHDAPLHTFQQMLLPGDTWCTDLVYRSGGLQISLAHVPPGPDEGQPGPRRLMCVNSFPETRVDLQFCGHVHGLLRRDSTTGCINVGVDVWDYQPTTLDQILARVHASSRAAHDSGGDYRSP